ncbi:Unknown protein [Striga hermonthica]|uniref:Reverse transcriptase domain-containing protein n=1 Tax=Striga hermonthica TaxID=68872 RepID=A0A9N7MXE5_STRHE|nr:Unknown protein [Striga hermonthica]
MEIKQAIDSCPSYSAPGPDGFPAAFYKKFWHLIGPETCEFIRTIFANGRFTSSLGFSYLFLIPKIATPLTIKDYRPISLCNIVYKFVTKVILYRLRPILFECIGLEQSAFLPGRGTSNNAIVLHEVLHKFNQRQRGCEFAIKIDLDKAYDRVKWKFLRDSLTQLGLDAPSVTLIMECVTSAHFAILWNGRPSLDIYPSRGLRQGDPISPYLFVIIMDRQTRTINREVSTRNWDPIVLSRGGPMLSHLLFADDVLIMAQANVATAKTVNKVLHAFVEEVGLAINLSKSKIIFSASTPVAKRNRICHQLFIPTTDAFDKYLGFPIIAGRRKVSHFEFIIERISRRLPPWGYEGIKRSKSQSSSVWTTLWRCFSIIANGFTYRLCNGETNFWEGIYLQGKPIKCLVDYVHISDSDKSCRQLIVNGRFDLQSLHTSFPDHIIKALTDARNIYLHPSVPDRWCWSVGSSGKYSVASCYDWLLKQGANTKTTWKKIWRLDVPEKINFFCWLIGHRSLPTKELRHRRHLDSTGACTICGDGTETWVHMFFECPWTTQVWAGLIHYGFPYRLTHTIPLIAKLLISSFMRRRGCSLPFVLCGWNAITGFLVSHLNVLTLLSGISILLPMVAGDKVAGGHAHGWG